MLFGNLSRRSFINLISMAGITAISAPLAGAAEWRPNRAADFLISYGPGGTADTLARYCINFAHENNKMMFVPVNKPGAGGELMLSSLKAAKPDGYTLGMCLSLQFEALPQSGRPSFSIDDFTPIGGVARAPMAVVTPSSSPFVDLTTLVAFSRQQNRPINCGSSPDLVWVASKIASHLGIEIVSVPFKGGAEMLQSALGGHIDMYLSGGSHVSLEKAGKLRTIAAMTSDRLPMVPNVATLMEQGIDVAIDPRFIIIGPKDLNTEAATALSNIFAKVIAQESVQEYMKSNLNLIVDYLGPAELQRALTDS